MRVFAIIVSSLIWTSVCSQNRIYPIEKLSPLSKILNQDSLCRYNQVLNYWTVYLNDKEIFAVADRKKLNDTLPFEIINSEKEKPWFLGERSVIQVEDGYLIGFDKGEWGGDLFWFSSDGKEKYEISSHQVLQFIKRNGKVYAIEGLDYGGSISYGSVIEIRKVNKKWEAIEYFNLPYAPAAINLDSANNFIIVTSNNLLRIDRNLKVDVLIENGEEVYFLHH